LALRIVRRDLERRPTVARMAQAVRPVQLETTLSLEDTSMTTTNGTIKRMTDKGFGFIATAEGIEYFFHQSACAGTRFDQLREGQSVSFTVGQGPKGPRAENVNVR
jgi:CspA family cold shock protein